jgi:hypothetical protein
MTVIYANLDTSPVDLRDAAKAQGLTTTQYIAATVNNAVKAWKRQEAESKKGKANGLDS